MKRIIAGFLVFVLVFGVGSFVSVAARTRGDVNGDGKVTPIDYAMVKRFVLGKYRLSEIGLVAADVNGDGRVNPIDYIILKRVVLGVSQFPHIHEFHEVIVGNIHIFICDGCGYQYETFDGELIG